MANDDVLSVGEDSAAAVDVLENDTDDDGDTLTIVDWTDGTHGSVICSGSNCLYIATTADFHGSDSFTYTVNDRPDGTGDSDTATVSVTVTPENDPPVAVDDQLNLADAATSGSLDVLANDTDLENDTLAVTLWTDGADGSVICVPAGTCTYTGGPSFTGVDSFTYTVSDGQGGTDEGEAFVCGSLAAAPSALAAAIATDPSVVTGASYVTKPCAKPNAVYTTALAGFPTESSSFAVLTSGNADLADDPDTAENSGANVLGPNVRGDSDFDVTVLKIDLSVPEGRNCLTFDFRFLSEEFEEFVGREFNDAFIAELDSSTWTTSGSSITAPNNFAFDAEGDVISINSTGATGMSEAEAAGTTYDGSTELLAASTPITPGVHSLFLSIFDQGDAVWDSAVFVDGLVLGTSAPGGCEAGATVLTTAKTADSASTPAGGTNGYTITVGNPSNAAVTLNSISDVLPTGFSYVAASTTGVTVADPTVTLSTLTWTGPFVVPASGSVTLHFGVTVSSTPGDYFNEASGDAAVGAVAPTGPTAKVTVTAAPAADVSITKTDSADPITAGQQLTYTLMVANSGPDPALGVEVTDTLPAGVTFVSASAGCSGTSTIACTIGTIASGGIASVSITVATSSDDDLTNTATVASTTADPVPANNTDTETTVVNAPSADVSITKTDSADPITAGQQLTYTLMVANSGPDPALDVEVTDTLPAGASFVSASAGCSGTTTVTCGLGTIASGSMASVSITVAASSDDDLTNTATVSSATADPSSANNTDMETTVVNPAPVPMADVSITKTDSADPITAGQQVTYTLMVANSGPDPAEGVQVTDTLPSGVGFVSAGAGCSGTTTVTCALGALASGASTSVTITIATSSDADLTNTATVTSATADPNGTNNTDLETTVVNPQTPTGPTCNGLRATFVGGMSNDYFQGGAGVDVVVDLGGHNYLQTGGGDDHVCLGGGDDEVDSGDGNDFVDAGSGKNKVKTGNGADSVSSGTGDDEIDTGDGDDQVTDAGGKNKIVTGNESDHVTAGFGDDEIETGNGSDVVVDGGGNNLVKTGDGGDLITTGAGNDEIDGGNGFDTCSPGGGSNKVKDCEGLPSPVLRP